LTLPILDFVVSPRLNHYPIKGKRVVSETGVLKMTEGKIVKCENGHKFRVKSDNKKLVCPKCNSELGSVVSTPPPRQVEITDDDALGFLGLSETPAAVPKPDVTPALKHPPQIRKEQVDAERARRNSERKKRLADEFRAQQIAEEEARNARQEEAERKAAEESRRQETAEGAKQTQVRCTNCDLLLQVDANHQVVSCPKCHTTLQVAKAVATVVAEKNKRSSGGGGTVLLMLGAAVVPLVGIFALPLILSSNEGDRKHGAIILIIAIISFLFYLGAFGGF